MPELPPPPDIRSEVVHPEAKEEGNGWVYWFVGVMILVIVAIVVLGVRRTNDPVIKEGLSPDFCKQHPGAGICNSSSQPDEASVPTPDKVVQPVRASANTETAKEAPQSVIPDPAVLKAVREEWIRNTQEALYREGMEITFQARGTTLYVHDVTAGNAYAFQFHETFLGQNGATLKTLGFKRVELSNGDKSWSWDLAGY